MNTHEHTRIHMNTYASTDWIDRARQTTCSRQTDNVLKTNKGKVGTTTYFATKYLSSPENLAKVARDRAEAPNFGGTMETKKFFTVSFMRNVM